MYPRRVLRLSVLCSNGVDPGMSLYGCVWEGVYMRDRCRQTETERDRDRESERARETERWSERVPQPRGAGNFSELSLPRTRKKNNTRNGCGSAFATAILRV